MKAADQARSAGHKLISNGFSTPNRGTVRVAHIRADNTPLCGKSLREPNRLNDKQYLGSFSLCAACARKV